jgi:hypothetical protein
MAEIMKKYPNMDFDNALKLVIEQGNMEDLEELVFNTRFTPTFLFNKIIPLCCFDTIQYLLSSKYFNLELRSYLNLLDWIIQNPPDNLEILDLAIDLRQKAGNIDMDIIINSACKTNRMDVINYFLDKFNLDPSIKIHDRTSIMVYHLLDGSTEIFKQLARKYSVNVSEIGNYLIDTLMNSKGSYNCRQIDSTFNDFKHCCKMVSKGFFNMDYNPEISRLLVQLIALQDTDSIKFIDYFLKNVKIDPVIIKSLLIVNHIPEITNLLQKYLESVKID